MCHVQKYRMIMTISFIVFTITVTTGEGWSPVICLYAWQFN